MTCTNPLLEKNPEAACIVNTHGRLLAANQRFCRMFGFQNEEAQWHYLSDLYRHASEWKLFRESANDSDEQRHFVARLRNRKGRSFKCRIARQSVVNDEGKLIFVNSIAKIDSPRDAVLPLAENGHTTIRQLYFNSCAECHRVQDAVGQWIMPDSSRSQPRRPQRPHYCPDCAAKLFPGVFDPAAQDFFEEEPVSAAR